MQSGIGLSLHLKHLDELLKKRPKLDWLELLVDNFLFCDEHDLRKLIKLREIYPFAFHGVGLSLGSVDPLNLNYLKRVRQLSEILDPIWYSEHIAWTSIHGQYLHELMPLPYTEDSVKYVSGRIQMVQEVLKEQILVENISCYMNFECATLSEAEFIKNIVSAADCLLLLDVSNIFVNNFNNKCDIDEFIEILPVDRVREYHLGGFEERDGFLLDSHSSKIDARVVALLSRCIKKFGDRATLIEWDNDVPSLEVLVSHAKKIKSQIGRAARRHWLNQVQA